MSRPNESKRPSDRRRVTMRRRVDLLAMRPQLERLEPLLLLSTLVVNTTADSGAGSLRDAITTLNLTPGPHEIDFKIGTGPVTIQPLSPLPSLAQQIYVNGASQTGFDATTRQPIVQIDGSKSGAAANGLVLSAGSTGSTISGLVISNFRGDGVDVTASNTNLIVGNFIGTDPTGNTPAGNLNGVVISGGSSKNTIGGFVGNNLRNQLISGNTGAGIVISGSGTTANAVSYTDVGTNGFNAPLPNQLDGIDINGADGNSVTSCSVSYNGHVDSKTSIVYGEGIQLQGSSNSQLTGNAIHDNVLSGINIQRLFIASPFTNLDSTGTLVYGSVIYSNGDHGVELTGTSATTVQNNSITSNGGDGVLLHDYGSLGGAHDNTIGGPSATVGQGFGNLISGNIQNGIEFLGTVVTAQDDNVIQGNLIGLDRNGTLFGNGGNGVLLGAGSGNSITGGNVISGNTLDGVLISSSFASGNLLGANFIGTNISGSSAAANGTNGVEINNAPNNVVDSLSLAIGVISGNSANGVLITGAGSTGNQVFGDRIGLDVSGSLAIPNGNDGVLVNLGASFNTIGGDAATGAANVISGNGNDGVLLQSVAINVVAGNLIGLGSDGLTPIPNSQYGVELAANAVFNTIGGLTATAGTGLGNVISGNDGGGVGIHDSTTASNVVLGNLIGTDAGGTKAVPNGLGVAIYFQSHDNTIGGSTAEAANIISGNQANTLSGLSNGIGVDIQDGANANLVAGNDIGTDISGTIGLGNATDGVGLFYNPVSGVGSGPFNNTIGGATAAYRNIISGNTGNGVHLSNSGTSNNLVAGNFIGVGSDGVTALANSHGVLIDQNATANNIGGQTATTGSGLGNVISGNTLDGVNITDAGTMGNLVFGNNIGTTADGLAPVPNGLQGVAIVSGASSNVVGVSLTTPSSGNLISGNQNGVVIGFGAIANAVAGNVIGLSADGTDAIPNNNPGDGVQLVQDGGFNTIGGTDPSQRNIISGNNLNGVGIDTSSNDLVEGNTIGTLADGSTPKGNGQNGVSVTAGSSNNTIGGLTTTAGLAPGNVISGNAGTGIHFTDATTANNLVEGNLIGTDAAGTVAVGNFAEGVRLDSAGSGNTIGGDSTTGAGNVISGNADTFGFGGGNAGVAVIGGGGAAGTGTLIVGNLIGTDITGTKAIFNGREGVYIGGSDVTVGGSAAGLGNLISGNGLDGIQIGDFFGFPTAHNLVLGNRIGTDITGNNPLPNQGDGIHINGGQSASTGNSIGSADVGGGNLIGGNVHTGIEFTATSSNLAINNTIGMRADGTDVLGNGFLGFDINQGSTGNTVGGTGVGQGNRINVTDAGFFALSIQSGSTGNLALGNTIGYNAAGTAALGTGNAVYVSSDHNTIGGTTAAARNYIAGASGYTGVWLNTAASFDNLVEGNYVGTTVDGKSSAEPVGGGTTGFAIDFATNNTIGGDATTGAGNLISGNAANGLDFQGASNNLVAGNLIGTDSKGQVAVGNGFAGVILEQASFNNTIGGPTTTAGTGLGNVISGNGSGGVRITGSGSSSNLAQGNLIGTTADGKSALANTGDGVFIDTTANGNGIGGNGVFNVISGNTGDGVHLQGVASNYVTNNLIGTDVYGRSAVANGGSGVFLSKADHNTIGANVISGNTNDGVTLVDAGTSNNLVEANYIGTTADGKAGLGNTDAGVAIFSAASSNTIGGAGTLGNLLSGNGFSGVNISTAGADSNVVQGNTIGTDIAGTTAIPNHGGISIYNHADNEVVSNNLIAGNLFDGIAISGSTSGDAVFGNTIGTLDSKGSPLGNFGSGIVVYDGATNLTIGGTTAAARNVIASSQHHGIQINDATTTAILIEGNYLGTDATGTIARGNGVAGVAIFNSPHGITVGGTAAGAGNLISGNVNGGVNIADSAHDILVSHNKIGTDVAGTAAVPNGTGLFIFYDGAANFAGATNNTVDGNLISGNTKSGVVIEGVGVSGNLVTNNLVGTDASGGSKLGNGATGIDVYNGATDNTIGGAGVGNLISGNGYTTTSSGVALEDAGVSGNVVQGNTIGTNLAGTAAIGNARDGVHIRLGAFGNLVGGDAAGTGNLIDGSGQAGVDIEGAGSTGNTVKGNLIGRSADGKSAIGNTGDGVVIKNGAANNTIGGTAATSQNIISASGGYGVHLSDAGTTGNVVQGNEIGDHLGAVALANLLDGVRFENGAANNLLGGTVAGAGNVIAFNAGNGVTVGSAVGDSTTLGDAILGNSIDSNRSGGIILTGFVANAPGSPHSGPNNLQNTPVIAQVTSNSTTTTIQGSINTNRTTLVHIEFFSNSSGSQGKTFLGSVDKMTDGGGNATYSFTAPSRLAPGVIVTATATVAGSTSQFSPTSAVVQVPDDVSLVVGVTRSGLLYNRATKKFVQTITIKNNSGHALTGPISLVLDHLSAGVSLFNATGTTTALNPPANSSYINLSVASLANGATATVQLQFTDPTFVAVTYTTRVLAGPGTR